MEPPKQNLKEKIVKKIKNLTWQDWLAIFITLSIFLVYFNLVSSFQQVPSPVFGGDYYRDRGFVKNIVEGGHIWSDGFYVDEIQYYPYFNFAIQAGIVQLTGLEVDTVFLYFPLLILLLASLVWYKLGTRFFKNKTWGLVTLTSFFAVSYSYGPKSSSVAGILLVPLFIYYWLKYEQENKKRDAYLSGITLGMISHFHGGKFLGAMGLMVGYVLFRYASKIWKNKKQFWQELKNHFSQYSPIIFTGIIIAMIYFLPLIIKYNFHSINNVTLWGDLKVSLMGVGWVLNLFKNMFFNTSNLFLLSVGVIAFIGLLSILFIGKNKELKFLLTLFILNILSIIHHLFTIPLFDYYFNPGKLSLIHIFTPLFFTFGLIVLYKTLVKKKINKKYFAILIIVLLLIPCFHFKYEDKIESRWTSYGLQKNPHTESLYELSDWITTHVKEDETILSNDESGFMLAMLSGRKVMLTRRTHASYFVDIDQRIAEADVAMYGQNLTQSKEILEKYNVKYFYMDQHLLTSSMRVRIDLADYLQKNKINFTKVHDRYDIALPMEQANTMDLLIILPQNITFMELWEKVYQVKLENQVIGELYRLKE